MLQVRDTGQTLRLFSSNNEVNFTTLLSAYSPDLALANKMRGDKD